MYRWLAEVVCPENAKTMYASLVEPKKYFEICEAYDGLFESAHLIRDSLMAQGQTEFASEGLVNLYNRKVDAFVHIFPLSEITFKRRVKCLVSTHGRYLQLPAWFLNYVKNLDVTRLSITPVFRYVVGTELILASRKLGLNRVRMRRRLFH